MCPAKHQVTSANFIKNRFLSGYLPISAGVRAIAALKKLPNALAWETIRGLFIA